MPQPLLQRTCWTGFKRYTPPHRTAATSRSGDGILQADIGVFPLFEGCCKATVEEALEGISLAVEGGRPWMCALCGHPTSDDYAEHMGRKHCGSPKPAEPPDELCVNDVLCLAHGTKSPAVRVYSKETPIYVACNASMRCWNARSLRTGSRFLTS